MNSSDAKLLNLTANRNINNDNDIITTKRMIKTFNYFMQTVYLKFEVVKAEKSTAKINLSSDKCVSFSRQERGK